jgi:hypothetical protein
MNGTTQPKLYWGSTDQKLLRWRTNKTQGANKTNSVQIHSTIGLVHRVISRRHTAVGQLADFQGANDEHISIDT